jgi:hypothetical protein
LKKFGINIKRLIVCLILGALAGIYCAIGTALFRRVSLEFLIYIWYNRVVLGFVISIADNINIIKNKYGNPIIRGALIGLIVGLILIIIPGVSAISYLIMGIFFGAVIDLIATLFAPAQSE